MAVDTSAIGKQTGAWRVILDRSVLTNFAEAVGDRSGAYRGNNVPAPPTFTFAAPYWSTRSCAEQPPNSTAGGQNPMHTIMGELYAQGALVLHGEQEFEYHRTARAGDVLDGVQRITFVIMETEWTDARDGAPVVTERFNLIARLKK